MVVAALGVTVATVLFGKAVSIRMEGRYGESSDMTIGTSMITCLMLILLVGGALLIFGSTSCE